MLENCCFSIFFHEHCSYSLHFDDIIDPLGRPTVTAGSNHCFRTRCPSVPTFQNLAKRNKFHAKTMFTTGDTVGLVEWIIAFSCYSTYTVIWNLDDKSKH